MDNVWEVRQGQGEQGELLAEHKNEDDGDQAHSDNCVEHLLHCLSHVPCASLVAWITLSLGLGGLTGSLLVGGERTRELLDDDRLLWFIEYTLVGVVCGMFVIGTFLLFLCHYSSDPNSRHAFNTSRKNTCARWLNAIMLILSYILVIAWIFASAILVIPVGMLVLLIYLKDYRGVRCVYLNHYGFSYKAICDTELERFTNEGIDLLICYVVAYFCAVVIIISLINFLMCISANITHLRDARFATLNAYVVTEDVETIKHNVNDTTM